ncbi:MAG: hypothetical protein ACRCUY_09645 [Thermoguttaceae bacterium]
MMKVIMYGGFVFAWLICGCNLADRHTPSFVETPPYYQSNDHQSKVQADSNGEMASQLRVMRSREIERLEKMSTSLDESQQNDKTTATSDDSAKKSFWDRFASKGDETFLMSKEAKQINENLK